MIWPARARLLAALAIGSGLFALGCERASLFTEPTVLPAPTAVTISPGTGIRGTTVRVTIVGTDFVSGGTTVSASGADVTVSNVSVDGTPPGPQASVSADLVIGLAAATGTRQITVATSFGYKQRAHLHDQPSAAHTDRGKPRDRNARNHDSGDADGHAFRRR